MACDSIYDVETGKLKKKVRTVAGTILNLSLLPVNKTENQTIQFMINNEIKYAYCLLFVA